MIGVGDTFKRKWRQVGWLGTITKKLGKHLLRYLVLLETMELYLHAINLKSVCSRASLGKNNHTNTYIYIYRYHECPRV